MTNIFMRFITIAFLMGCLYVVPGKLNAQLSAADSTVRASAINNTIRQYHSFFAPASALYNGPQYVDYTGILRAGQPFFQSADFNPGNIMYDHILYENIPLKYDLVKSNVVIRDLTGDLDISLLNDKVSSFTVLGHSFIRLVKDSAGSPLITTGFYEVLYRGQSVTLLKKETKKILEDLNALDGIKRSIDDLSDFYVVRNNKYYRVNGKNALLDLFKDKSAAIKQYIRQNKIKFKEENIDGDLVAVVSYADKL